MHVYTVKCQSSNCIYLFIRILLSCTVGGVSKAVQKTELSAGVVIIVATPGRLLDLMEEGTISLSQVVYVVLDEADRMLDDGFEPGMCVYVFICVYVYVYICVCVFVCFMRVWW